MYVIACLYATALEFGYATFLAEGGQRIFFAVIALIALSGATFKLVQFLKQRRIES
jgi:hypothetical protein